MSRFIDPFPQYIYEGDIVTNGYMYFLEPGTTGFNNADLKDTWSDPGFTVLNTNPIQLDGDGRVPDVFLQGNYRVALYTYPGIQDGELVFDIDNYEGSPISEQFGDWSNTTNYGLDDYVQASDGFIYRSLQANNLNHNPLTSATWWTKIAFISFYNANETYAVDAVVLYSGILYTSLVANNTGNTPSSSPSEWQSFSGTVAANTVSYDNTSSGLTAANAQAAIDELQAGKQPLDTDLTAFAALSSQAFGRSLNTAADAAGILTLLGITATIAQLNYSNGVTSSIQSQINSKLTAASNLSDLASAATSRTNLGVAIGTNVQAFSAILAALAGLSPSGDKITRWTGGSSADLLDFAQTITGTSATKLISEAGIKAYADALIAANDAMVFQGVIDCSTNPNYPAADRGDTYKVSVAGKIGGGSGPNVEIGDLLLCITDSTASGDHATVGANWNISQVNIDGAVVGPASSVDGNFFSFSGTGGKVAQDSGYGPASFQAQNANLQALAGLVSAADTLGYFTGSGTAALTTLSAFIRTLLDDANQTAAQATLGVDPAGTDNSTNVTLAGSLDYLTLSGQEITRGPIDLTTDVTGVLPVANGGTASAISPFPIFKRKTADTTRASTTTYSDDPDLAAFSLAVGTYSLECELPVYTGSTPGLKFQFQIASGTVSASSMGYILTKDLNGGTTYAGFQNGDITSEFSPTFGTNGEYTLRIRGYVVVSVAAVIDFQWAQATSDALSTAVKAHSHIKFTPVN